MPATNGRVCYGSVSMTDRIDPVALVRSLEAELEEVEELERKVTQRAQALRQTLAGARALAGISDATASPSSVYVSVGVGTPAIVVQDGAPRDPNAPRGSQAALRVLEAGPDEGMTLDEVFQAYAARGWLPDTAEPLNAIRAALNRLRRSKTVVLDPESKRFRRSEPQPDDEYLAELAEAREQEHLEAREGLEELLADVDRELEEAEMARRHDEEGRP
jgi:hypothetical protein